MPSSNKTGLLALNDWAGTDKPKRTDFNEDNRKIDAGVAALSAALSAHTGSAPAHVSTADREKLAALLPMDFYTYTGDGKLTRRITLGYRPKLAFVIAIGRPMFEINAYDLSLKQFCAMVSQYGCSTDIALEDDGLSFVYSSHNQLDGNGLRLNENGVSFLVISMR